MRLNVVTGKQNIPADGPKFLKYGQSVTDACVDFPETVKILEGLREGVRARRKLVPEGSAGVLRNGLMRSQANDQADDVKETAFNDLSALRRERKTNNVA